MCTLAMRPGFDTWEFACIYFHSGRAARKENGYYLIPIFIGEGGDKIGHYILAIIHKTNTSITGNIFDSMGTITSISTHRELNTLEQIFKSQRHSIVWKIWNCVRQTEMECGIQALYGMVQSCRGAANNLHANTIFNNIAEISSRREERTNLFVREKIADVINNTNNWWTENDTSSSHNQTVPLNRSDTRQNVRRNKRGHRHRSAWTKKRQKLGKSSFAQT